MKIYTKTGDTGETSLIDNVRVPKDDIRVEAYGTVDELNAHIALISTLTSDNNCKQILLDIEKTLFVVQTHLAINDKNNCNIPIVDINEIKPKNLESAIDEMQAILPKNHSFILLSANEIAAQCHIARTICRRCERRLVSLNRQKNVDSIIMCYINRLSDFLFILARYFAFVNNNNESELSLRKNNKQ